MPELVSRQMERTKIELENILRWEDGGGPVFEIDNPFPEVVEDHAQEMDALSKISYRTYHSQGDEK